MPLSDSDYDQLKKDIEEILDLRVKPANGSYGILGELIYQWATDPSSRPELHLDGSVKDVEALKTQIEPHFSNLPDIKRIVFVQPQPGEYYIRLPAKELVQKSFSIMNRLQQLSEQQTDALGFTYPDPGFYQERIAGDEPMPELDYLKNRVGDYTFAHCA